MGNPEVPPAQDSGWGASPAFQTWRPRFDTTGLLTPGRNPGDRTGQATDFGLGSPTQYKDKAGTTLRLLVRLCASSIHTRSGPASNPFSW